MLKGWLREPQSTGTETFNSAVSNDETAFAFTSVGASRDQEVSFVFNNQSARLYLRKVGDRAVLFDFGSSYFNIYLTSGLNTTSYYGGVEKKMHEQGAGLTNGATYIFGVSGFDIYVKRNGTEIVRFKSIHHWFSGGVACKVAGTGGTRPTMTITYNPDAALYSTLGSTSVIYDPRDFGVASVATTGSITAASTTLTVASATGFAVGDHVIVEIGAEAGAGARGTKGVGGTWPSLSYANAAARTAATPANNTFAWQEDTGEVWRYVSSAWTQPYSSSYYLNKAAPRSLQAKITAISGNDLTLNVAATVSATNANVYLDCTPYINLMTYHIWYKFGDPTGDLTGFVRDGLIRFPAGTFYCGGQVYLGPFASEHLRIEGAGDTTILKSPKGVPSMSIHVADGVDHDPIVSSLKMVGNVRDTGYGMDWPSVQAIPYGSGSGGMEWDYADGTLTETSYTQGDAFPHGILMVTCTRCSVENVTSVDIWQASVGASYSTDCWARDCSTTMTDGLRMYIQWAYQWSDSTGGGIDTCTVTSPRLIAGFETFRSSGVTITGCTGNNASYSSNSSGNFAFTNCTCAVTVTDNVEATSGFSIQNPMFNINSNITPADATTSLGGTLTNCVMTQTYIDANNNSLRGIVVNADNPNITIAGGSYTASNYASPTTLDGACGINATGANTDISNFTVTGQSRYAGTGSGLRNIHCSGASTIASGSSITNCTAGDTYLV